MYCIKVITFLCNYGKRLSYIGGCTLLSRVVGGTRLSQRQPGTFIFIDFTCNTKYFTSEFNKIDKNNCDYDITKQIRVVFLL